MKKFTTIIFLFVFAFALVGCKKEDENTIKIGINGSEMRIWDHVKAELAKEDITLEVVIFADYVQPNIALSEGSIDVNMFQTIIYFEDFIAQRNLDLVNIGQSILAPMGIYSEKITSIDQVEDGAEVAIPNDVTNGGRALILLQSAGLITLKEGVGLLPTKQDITSNPKNLVITELNAPTIPRVLKDIDFAVINNGVAVEAGLSPKKDSIFIEDASSDAVLPYINIFAARREDKDDPKLKRLVDIYQSEEVRQLIEDIYDGGRIPAF